MMNNTDNTEKYQMVIECVDSYEVTKLDNGDIIIEIKIPKRYSLLWRTKIENLYTTYEEIKEYE